MKLRVLIERLEEIEQDLQAGLGDDVEPEIVCAYQESYPLAGTLMGAVVLEADEDADALLLGGNPIVWLAVGTHPDGISPYAPRAVFTGA